MGKNKLPSVWQSYRIFIPYTGRITQVMPRIIPEYKEEVRKKIIGIAYQLFLSRGYRGTTMEDIAGALGVTKPALYQYFPGKIRGRNWKGTR